LDSTNYSHLCNFSSKEKLRNCSRKIKTATKILCTVRNSFKLNLGKLVNLLN
jgi:hypothetical protein